MQLKPELTLLLLSVSCLFLFVFVCVGCVSCVCVRVFMDDRIELEEIPFYIQAEEEHMEQVDNDRRSNFRQVLSLLRVGLSDTSPSSSCLTLRWHLRENEQQHDTRTCPRIEIWRAQNKSNFRAGRSWTRSRS